ncbi:unnamed protein product [Fusarium fujikuroi]|uniref:Uncharacterized protein n=1 Tax=Fusarium fujikuroi TaxID=5127 RepID=A0A9Q9U4G6_FUSFU|nr:unnamed protein product [Fusarium fujikuroi]
MDHAPRPSDNRRACVASRALFGFPIACGRRTLFGPKRNTGASLTLDKGETIYIGKSPGTSQHKLTPKPRIIVDLIDEYPQLRPDKQKNLSSQQSQQKKQKLAKFGASPGGYSDCSFESQPFCSWLNEAEPVNRSLEKEAKVAARLGGWNFRNGSSGEGPTNVMAHVEKCSLSAFQSTDNITDPRNSPTSRISLSDWDTALTNELGLGNALNLAYPFRTIFTITSIRTKGWHSLAKLGRYYGTSIPKVPNLRIQSHPNISVAFCAVFHHYSFTSFHKSHVSPIKTNPLPPGIFPERSLGSVISFQFLVNNALFFPSHMATFPRW